MITMDHIFVIFLHFKKYKTERKFILHLEQLLSFAFGIAKVRFDHDTGRIVSCNNTDKLWSGAKSVVWLHIVPELLKVVTKVAEIIFPNCHREMFKWS